MTAPLWFRKLPIAEHGAFGQLPFLVRGTAAMILKFCDDQGVFALGGRQPVDAVCRKCGAEPRERKAIADHIEQLLHVGYLRLGNNALIVVDQAEQWEQLSSQGSRPRSGGRRTWSEHRPDMVRDVHGTSAASFESDLSARNHSTQNPQQDKRREEQKREDKEEETRAEGVQGEQVPQAPKTDPTPTLRKLDRSKLPLESSNHWSLQGTAYGLQDLRAEDQGAQTPTPLAAPPSPSPRQEPLVTVVDPPPVPRSKDASTGVYGTSKRASGEGAGQAPAKPKGKSRRTSGGEHVIPEEWTPKESHYEHAAREYGYTTAHVDVEASAMRDQYLASGKMYTNWDAHFRNWLRWGWERRGKPPVIPPKPEPRRPMPPPPPRDPEIEAGIRRLQERQAAGEVIDWRAAINKVGRPFVLPPIPPVSLDEFGIEADK